MGKKSSAKRATAKPAQSATLSAVPPSSGVRLWKWLALLVVGVGVGVGAFSIFGGDRPFGKAPEGMVWIPRGKFTMGTDDPNPHFVDAHPMHDVEISGFWMDEAEVTNAQFAEFVAATGYVTVAEQPPTMESMIANRAAHMPPPRPEELIPSSVVFSPPNRLVPTNDSPDGWNWVAGAYWKHPEGPDSDIKDRMNHPVVHVCWKDADAYAKWAGKRLPTEAEWERAARGGLVGKQYVWGDDAPAAGGQWRCNIWQGKFPHTNTLADGYLRTAPVKSYPPNAYGLYDMAGNVWEWCADWYTPTYYANSPRKNPLGPDASYDPSRPDVENPYMPKRVQRGGSFLCSDGFCSRYKPYGRGKGDVDTGQSHVGFRCAKDR
jgi:formylglycine-generating enzyme